MFKLYTVQLICPPFWLIGCMRVMNLEFAHAYKAMNRIIDYSNYL